MLDREQSISPVGVENLPEQPVEENGDKVDLTLIRHSKPEYFDIVVGKKFDEAVQLLSQGVFEKSGIEYPEGFRIAQEVGQDWKEKQIIPDLIISSPASRATETAILVAGEITKERQQTDQIPITIDGSFSELTPEVVSIQKAYSEVGKELSNPGVISTPDEARLIFRTAIGIWMKENLSSIEAKVDLAVDRLKALAKKHHAFRILIISHGIMLRAIKARLQGQDIASILLEDPISYCDGFYANLDNESGMVTIRKEEK